VEEKIERHDALRKAAFDMLPFGIGDDARNQVEGEKALGAPAVTIDGEGDALNQEREVGKLAALFKMTGRESGEFLNQLGISQTRLAGGREHLVVKAPSIVALEQTGPHHLSPSRSHWALL
jgi:hypothetical protein